MASLTTSASATWTRRTADSVATSTCSPCHGCRSGVAWVITVARVHLRPVTAANVDECLALSVAGEQVAHVAPNAKSLAQASVNPNFVPLAIYDRLALGYETPPVPMVGFTMYELAAGVGYIMRLMIDRKHQRQGYGRAAMIEVIRRLRLIPQVELIATSHRHDNEAAASLYASLGFVHWEIGFATEHPEEIYLVLPDA